MFHDFFKKWIVTKTKNPIWFFRKFWVVKKKWSLTGEATWKNDEVCGKFDCNWKFLANKEKENNRNNGQENIINTSNVELVRKQRKTQNRQKKANMATMKLHHSETVARHTDWTIQKNWLKNRLTYNANSAQRVAG